MAILAFLLYALGLATFAWFYVLKARRDAALQRHLEIAEYKTHCFEDCPHKRLHDITNSAILGSPMVRFAHPSPVPSSADHWYFRVRIEGLDHLFTEEAVRSARRRAELLIPVKLPSSPSGEACPE